MSDDPVACARKALEITLASMTIEHARTVLQSAIASTDVVAGENGDCVTFSGVHNFNANVGPVDRFVVWPGDIDDTLRAVFEERFPGYSLRYISYNGHPTACVCVYGKPIHHFDYFRYGDDEMPPYGAHSNDESQFESMMRGFKDHADCCVYDIKTGAHDGDKGAFPYCKAMQRGNRLSGLQV